MVDDHQFLTAYELEGIQDLLSSLNRVHRSHHLDADTITLRDANADVIGRVRFTADSNAYVFCYPAPEEDTDE